MTSSQKSKQVIASVSHHFQWSIPIKTLLLMYLVQNNLLKLNAYMHLKSLFNQMVTISIYVHMYEWNNAILAKGNSNFLDLFCQRVFSILNLNFFRSMARLHELSKFTILFHNGKLVIYVHDIMLWIWNFNYFLNCHRLEEATEHVYKTYLEN